MEKLPSTIKMVCCLFTGFILLIQNGVFFQHPLSLNKSTLLQTSKPQQLSSLLTTLNPPFSTPSTSPLKTKLHYSPLSKLVLSLLEFLVLSTPSDLPLDDSK